MNGKEKSWNGETVGRFWLEWRGGSAAEWRWREGGGDGGGGAYGEGVGLQGNLDERKSEKRNGETVGRPWPGAPHHHKAAMRRPYVCGAFLIGTARGFFG